jgi:hypothetical protein
MIFMAITINIDRPEQAAAKRAAAIETENSGLAPFREAGLVISKGDSSWRRWQRVAKRGEETKTVTADGRLIDVRPIKRVLADGSTIIQLIPTSLEVACEVLSVPRESNPSRGRIFRAF